MSQPRLGMLAEVSTAVDKTITPAEALAVTAAQPLGRHPLPAMPGPKAAQVATLALPVRAARQRSRRLARRLKAKAASLSVFQRQTVVVRALRPATVESAAMVVRAAAPA